MAVPKKVVIIGDGGGGIILANKLRMHVNTREAEIIVIGNSPHHYFKPDSVLIPFNLKNERSSVKSNKFLVNHGVRYLSDEAILIDPESRRVRMKSGMETYYDFLVIATGSRLVPEEVPGYNYDVKHFYDYQHTMELKSIMKDFNGGNVVIGQASVPIQCPPAPFEFTLLLDDYLRSKGLRDKTTIDYVYPINRVFTIKHVADYVQKLFDEKEIQYHTMFNVDHIDSKNNRLVSLEGEDVDYTLLVLVPPHRGQKVITDSGLAEGLGFVNVDKHKLTYGKYDDIFVIGDATDLPIPKNGAAAHFQAAYLSGKLSHEIAGFVYEDDYNGENCCPPFMSRNTSISVFMSYSKAPRGYAPSKLDFLFKYTSSETYFTGMLRGML